MFGNDQGGWASPYEYDRVATTRTTFYDEPGATVYKKASGAKGAKGATVYRPNPAHVARHRAAQRTPGFQYHSGLTPAMLRHQGMRGFGAFGAASSGLSTGANCGSVAALQTALNTLGYPCAVDNIWGPETKGALSSFASERGVSYNGGTPSGAVCQALSDAVAQQGQPTEPAPAPASAPGSSTEQPSGALDSLKNWWTAASTTTKTAVVGGGVLATILVAMAVSRHAHKKKH